MCLCMSPLHKKYLITLTFFLVNTERAKFIDNMVCEYSDLVDNDEQLYKIFAPICTYAIRK